MSGVIGCAKKWLIGPDNRVYLKFSREEIFYGKQ